MDQSERQPGASGLSSEAEQTVTDLVGRFDTLVTSVQAVADSVGRLDELTTDVKEGFSSSGERFDSLATILRGGDATTSKDPSLGILFVHGLGDNKRGDSLLQAGEPLFRWLHSWMNSDQRDACERVHLDNTRLSTTIPGEVNAPAYSELHFTTSEDPAEPDSRWVLAESWWAPTFPQATYSDFAIWGLGILPWLITRNATPLMRRIFGAFARMWDVLRTAIEDTDEAATTPTAGMTEKARRLAWRRRRRSAVTRLARRLLAVFVLAAGLLQFGALLLTSVVLTSALVLVAQVGLLALVLLAFIPPVQGIILGIQKGLANNFGDGYLITTNPMILNASISQVRRDIDWLRNVKHCKKIAIIAHSGGTYVSYRLLREPPEARPKVDLLVTYGNGLSKLGELEELFTKRTSGFTGGLVLHILALLVPVLLGGLLPHALSLALALWVLGDLFIYVTELHLQISFTPQPLDGTTWRDFYSVADPAPDGALRTEKPVKPPAPPTLWQLLRTHLSIGIRAVACSLLVIAALAQPGIDPWLGIAVWALGLLFMFFEATLPAGTNGAGIGGRLNGLIGGLAGNQTWLLRGLTGLVSLLAFLAFLGWLAAGVSLWWGLLLYLGAVLLLLATPQSAPQRYPPPADSRVQNGVTSQEVDNLDSIIQDHGHYWYNNEQFVPEVVRACAAIACEDNDRYLKLDEQQKEALNVAVVRRQNRVFAYLMSGILAIMITPVFAFVVFPYLQVPIRVAWGALAGLFTVPLDLLDMAAPPASPPDWFSVPLGLALVAFAVALYQRIILFSFWRDWRRAEETILWSAGPGAHEPTAKESAAERKEDAQRKARSAAFWFLAGVINLQAVGFALFVLVLHLPPDAIPAPLRPAALVESAWIHQWNGILDVITPIPWIGQAAGALMDNGKEVIALIPLALSVMLALIFALLGDAARLGRAAAAVLSPPLADDEQRVSVPRAVEAADSNPPPGAPAPAG